ncbi:hypothetical protein EI94DRAFT_1696143 [Lactarius quietus]|nr:hypothetical protein EI94DRAFT_1696143 [Lactarius quietus]
MAASGFSHHADFPNMLPELTVQIAMHYKAPSIPQYMMLQHGTPVQITPPHKMVRSSRCVQILSNVWSSDADQAANTHTDAAEAIAHVDHVGPSQDTGMADSEDTTDTTVDENGPDPEDTIDANLLEILTRDFNLSATVNPEERYSAPSDQPQSTGFESDDPAQLPQNPFEPGNSGGATSLVVDNFPHGRPEAPIPGEHEGSNVYCSTLESFQASLWALFRSQLPPFKCEDLVIASEKMQLYFWDILHCIRTLFGDPEFAHDLVFAPVHHYTDNQWTSRVYSEMYTGALSFIIWQACSYELSKSSLEAQQPGATVIPVIISSDKTQLMLFCGNTAYPVYLTIGKIPKDIYHKPLCRAQILIAHLLTSHLEGMGNKAARCHTLQNIFHSCMWKIMAPITACGETGVAMMSGDGKWRCCHLILAAFIGDYPEQALVTCTYQGQCPKCLAEPESLGDYSRSPP